MIVIEGDAGYIIGADPDGTPKLLPVQGSSKPHPGKLSAAERDAILAQVQAQSAVFSFLPFPTRFFLHLSGNEKKQGGTMKGTERRPEEGGRA
jgi:hypothetical protein